MTTENTTPAAPTADDQRIFAAVQELFETHINPALQSHGGYAKLVKVEGKVVHVELGGGCRGCPGARMTMRNGVEHYIRQVAPDVAEVVDVTDHDG